MQKNNIQPHGASRSADRSAGMQCVRRISSVASRPEAEGPGMMTFWSYSRSKCRQGPVYASTIVTTSFRLEMSLPFNLITCKPVTLSAEMWNEPACRVGHCCACTVHQCENILANEFTGMHLMTRSTTAAPRMIAVPLKSLYTVHTSNSSTQCLHKRKSLNSRLFSFFVFLCFFAKTIQTRTQWHRRCS